MSITLQHCVCRCECEEGQAVAGEQALPLFVRLQTFASFVCILHSPCSFIRGLRLPLKHSLHLDLCAPFIYKGNSCEEIFNAVQRSTGRRPPWFRTPMVPLEKHRQACLHDNRIWDFSRVVESTLKSDNGR